MKMIWMLVVLCLAGCGGDEPPSSTRQTQRETPAREDATTAGKEVADTLNAAQDRARAVESLVEDGKADIDAALEAAEQADDD